jgi:hypothetical protein
MTPHHHHHLQQHTALYLEPPHTSHTPSPAPQPLLAHMAALLRVFVTTPCTGQARRLQTLLDAGVEAFDRLDEVDWRYRCALRHERLPELLVRVLQEYAGNEKCCKWVAAAGGAGRVLGVCCACAVRVLCVCCVRVLCVCCVRVLCACAVRVRVCAHGLGGYRQAVPGGGGGAAVTAPLVASHVALVPWRLAHSLSSLAMADCHSADVCAVGGWVVWEALMLCMAVGCLAADHCIPVLAASPQLVRNTFLCLHLHLQVCTGGSVQRCYRL